MGTSRGSIPRHPVRTCGKDRRFGVRPEGRRKGKVRARLGVGVSVESLQNPYKWAARGALECGYIDEGVAI